MVLDNPMKRILFLVFYLFPIFIPATPDEKYYLSGYYENLFIPDVYNSKSIGMGNTHILIDGNFLANPALTSKTPEFSSTFKVKYGSQDIYYRSYPYSYEGIYEKQYDLHSISLSNSIPLKNKSIKVGYGFGFNTLYDWSVKSKEESEHYVGVPKTVKFLSEGGPRNFLTVSYNRIINKL